MKNQDLLKQHYKSILKSFLYREINDITLSNLHEELTSFFTCHDLDIHFKLEVITTDNHVIVSGIRPIDNLALISLLN